MALEPGLSHLARVGVVFSPKIGTLIEEACDSLRHFLRYYAAKRPSRHGDDPFPEPAAFLRVARLINMVDELRLDVPVAAKVDILDGVHGTVLQGREIDLGSE